MGSRTATKLEEKVFIKLSTDLLNQERRKEERRKEERREEGRRKEVRREEGRRKEVRREEGRRKERGASCALPSILERL